ncbi:MAG: hypothetical protein ABI438_04925 [Dermatophilaceae bacterium]
MKHIDSRPMRMIGVGLVASAVAVTASACGGSSSGATAAPKAAAAPKTVNISMTGKIDADTGPAGTFTSKEHWPAMDPSDITISKGDTIVLTIKEYDDAPTALPAGSPYNAVAGGTETVDGVAVTTVSNTDIAHTFSIPELGINAPLPKAPDGGFSTIVFTFKVDKAGSYTWRCFTPCGGDPKGMGGSMATMGWMKGNVTVA